MILKPIQARLIYTIAQSLVSVRTVVFTFINKYLDHANNKIRLNAIYVLLIVLRVGLRTSNVGLLNAIVMHSYAKVHLYGA